MRNNGAPLPPKFKKWLKTNDPFTAWFPLYKNQERFKEDMHRHYKGEITDLQRQVKYTKGLLRDAEWEKCQAISERGDAEERLEDALKSMEKMTFNARNEAFSDVCNLLKHYDLKPL